MEDEKLPALDRHGKRSRAQLAAAILRALAPLANELAEMLAERAEEPPLVRWPGTPRALRRTQARLRERGFEMPAFELGRGAWYVSGADLEALPQRLGDRRERGTGYRRPVAEAPANDATEEAVDIEAAALALNAAILGEPLRRKAGARASRK